MRKKPEVRQQEILKAAMALSIRHGYTRITREQIAKDSKCSANTVQYHFPTMDDLRRAIIYVAIRDEVLAVIAQGITHNERLTKRIDVNLRKRALLSFVSDARK